MVFAWRREVCVQGDEDKIVPPNQAEDMYAALKEKGIPTALKMYDASDKPDNACETNDMPKLEHLENCYRWW